MHDRELRKHLTELLTGDHAHPRFEDVVKDFPVERAGIRPAGSPHSAWELLEHIRIALDDIILFSGAMEQPRPTGSRELPKGYVPLNWPGDYWPASPAPRDANQWNASVAGIEQGVAACTRMIEDPKRDLFEPFPWGEGQTLLREALLVADHNAYHLGQLLLVRRMIEQN